MICDCGHEFKSKQLSKTRVVDWKSLKKGDLIITVPGSFYLTENEDGTKERKPFGYRGKGQVHEIRENGILIYSSDNETDWIYMGKNYYDENIGIYKRPALIGQYKPKKRKITV